MNKQQNWLLSLKRSRRRVQNLLEQIAMLQAQATKITAVLDDIGGGSSHNVDGFERTLARLIDKKNELNALINEQFDIQEQVEKSIEKVPDETQRTILYERYVLEKQFEQISEHVKLSIRRTFTLHGYGLLKVKVPQDNDNIIT